MNEIISPSADDPLLPVCRILHTYRTKRLQQGAEPWTNIGKLTGLLRDSCISDFICFVGLFHDLFFLAAKQKLGSNRTDSSGSPKIPLFLKIGPWFAECKM
ncbi:hypothetical protein H5410_032085 [Solanum commersonii]|uniref:Uncharacterized protein n=1 Tax=Solanum commersonii TaxID=4109 RepID=A0A9J5YIZ3_SOLCO|nr:hypothetical protein H5410_032085 [Solanum commersonii]